MRELVSTGFPLSKPRCLTRNRLRKGSGVARDNQRHGSTKMSAGGPPEGYRGTVKSRSTYCKFGPLAICVIATVIGRAPQIFFFAEQMRAPLLR